MEILGLQPMRYFFLLCAFGMLFISV